MRSGQGSTLIEKVLWGFPQGADPSARLAAVDQSIRQHLERLLNTRQGQAMAQVDYGMPDLNAIVHHRGDVNDVLEDARRKLEETIRRHEPRLHSVRVSRGEKPEDDPTVLRFEIQARLRGFRERAQYSAVLSEGEVRVSG